MKILVTGAHFTTAQAVIKELSKNAEVKIVYVGRKTTREGDNSPSPESELIPRMGVKYISIITGRLQRAFTIYTIPSLLKIPIGLVQSAYILLTEKPDVILSFGGYVAVPLIIWGWFLSIPIIIHEQTLVTGLANKISSFFADKIAISFDSNHSFDKTKTVLTGNPIREEILESNKVKDIDIDLKNLFNESKKEKLPVVFVTGGNQGSHIINTAVEEILDDLTKKCCLIHQTGDSKFKDFERLSAKQSNRYYVKDFFATAEMAYSLANSDLVVSRAGINTLTELAYLGTPALVIPVPYLYQDEQNKNSKYFENLGLVKILHQSNLSSKSLLKEILQILKNIKTVTEKAKRAKSAILLNGAEKVALETLILGAKTEV